MPGPTSLAPGASAEPAAGAARGRGAGTQQPSLLGGRYDLDCALGGGGMGIVYRAADRVLGRTVAIKLLALGGAAADASSVARFEREARAAASLSHPNIVSVFDA